VTRPEGTNQRSEAESKETEHGGDLYSTIVETLDSTVDQSLGEEQHADEKPV